MFFHVDDWESWRHNTPGWAWLADPRGRHSAASPSCTARPHWPRSTEENCPHLWSSRCPTGKKGLAYRSSADNVIDLLSCIDVRVCTLVLHTHTHTQPFNGLWSGTTRVGRYQKKHSPTHTHPDHRTSFIIFLHLQRSMASTLFILRAWQSSRTTSLQVLFGLLVFYPKLHTPYICSPNHHLLFAAHAHTNDACSAAIPMLCHLYLVSLSTPYLGVCLLA